MGFYNVLQGDAPYFKNSPTISPMSDNYHQPAMGGTGLDSIMLGFADAIWFSDASGNPAVPPHNVQVWADQPAGCRAACRARFSGLFERHLDAAEALRAAVGGASKACSAFAAVESRHPHDPRVAVVRAVGVSPLIVVSSLAQEDREGADFSFGAGDAGVGRGFADDHLPLCQTLTVSGSDSSTQT